MSECSVCCEPINRSGRRPVLCPHCTFLVCVKCVERYLLESPNVPDCMNCHIGFSVEFITSSLTKTFYNSIYRRKQAEDLISREKSLLAATQPIVERRRELRQELKDLNQTIGNNERIIGELRQSLDSLYFEQKFLRNRTSAIANELNGSTNADRLLERSSFNIKCPIDGCRGFLSSQYKCGLCDTYSCSKCLIPKSKRDDDTHICNKDDVESVVIIRQQTKPCPNCHVPIYKISGCDQMWCCQCHTAFSWNTGRVVKDKVHNPHYYEWIRQNGGQVPRDPLDTPHCLTAKKIMMKALSKNSSKQYKKDISQALALIEHIRQVELPRFDYTENVDNHTDLRVKYLENDINEDSWKSYLKARIKRGEKNRRVSEILTMVADTLTDIFAAYMQDINDDPMNAVRELVKFSNIELNKISYQYNNKIPTITDELTIVYR